MEYVKERDINNIEKIYGYLERLPSFCTEYFIGMENVTSPLTRLNYCSDLKLFFEFLLLKCRKFSDVPDLSYFNLSHLAMVSVSDIEQFLSFSSFYRNNNGTKRVNQENGKKRKLSAIRSLFKYFYNKDKLPENVSAKVSCPKIHDKEIIRLDDREIKNIITDAGSGSGLNDRQLAFHQKTSLRDVAIITLFLGTGIRISELVGIDIDDVNFTDNSFVVTRKGGNRVMLFFNDEVKNALMCYMEIRLNNDKVAKGEKALFLSLQNKRITPRAVENLVKKYAVIAAPQKKISPHKLRSTYGTKLYRETGDIYVVAEVLGHKDVNTTKKHYAATSEDIRRKASQKVTLLENYGENKDE